MRKKATETAPEPKPEVEVKEEYTLLGSPYLGDLGIEINQGLANGVNTVAESTGRFLGSIWSSFRKGWNQE